MLASLNSAVRILCLCFLIVFMNSCDEKKVDPEKTNYIEAKVNGALWSPSSVTCILLIDTNNNFRIVDFTASSAGKLITIEADDHATGSAINTGTRTFTASSAFFSYNNSSIPYQTIDGSIDITAVEASSQLITGTFGFTVQDNSGNLVQITGGRFEKVNYSVKTQ
ncbi:MAG: hypothetical protein ABI763_08390 [Bacteroidota bacterium]